MIQVPKFKFVLREDLKDDKQFVPVRAESKASGWDVRAAQKDRQPILLRPFDKILIPLGFKAFCPEGWWFELKPRSSTFAKKHLHSLYGTIDETYEGEVQFACQYIPPPTYVNGWVIESPPVFTSENTLQINFGDAIGQIIPIERREMSVEEITTEEYEKLCQDRQGERGAGGFGSSDSKK